MDKSMVYTFSTSLGQVEVTGPKLEELPAEELWELVEFLKLIQGRADRVATRKEIEAGKLK